MSPRRLRPIVALIGGILLVLPFTRCQLLVSQGDHGRDLYAFQATLRGETPYRDYWWVYGPLMPYYYAGVFRLLGTDIHSAVLGKTFLHLLAAVLLTAALDGWIPGLFAVLAGFWFLLYDLDFFYTYNHAGGIAALMLTVFGLLRYLASGRTRRLDVALAGAVLTALVKINFGVIALGMTLLTAWAAPRLLEIPPPTRRFRLTALVGAPLLILGVYAAFTAGLPLYALRQCFPYLTADHPHHMSVGRALILWGRAVASTVNASWPDRFFALVILLSLVQIITALSRGILPPALRTRLPLVGSLLILFYAANFHEYLVSGVPYRTYWSQPFSIMLIFLVIGTSARTLTPFARGALLTALAGLLALRFSVMLDEADRLRGPEHVLALPRGRIHTANPPEWIRTVTTAVRYLETHLRPGETFFALPYDPLYYFLTNRPSPTRQLIFFEHIRIPPVQERRIIADLERRRIRYVLISNRADVPTPGLGVLGRTYCPLLGRYIETHFEEVFRTGEWENPAGWAWLHGVKILKRRGRGK